MAIAGLDLTPEQEAEAARIKARMLPEIEQEVELMAELLASRPTDRFFGATEFDLRDGCDRIGVRTLQAALDERKKEGTQGRPSAASTAANRPDSMTIAAKRRRACWGKWSFTAPTTVAPDCSHTECLGRLADGPGNHKLTPAAAQAICRCACQESFERSTESLYELTGLRLSESKARCTAEDVGADIGARLERGETFGESETWSWSRDGEGRTCAYLSIDATGIPMQGPKGPRAPRRTGECRTSA